MLDLEVIIESHQENVFFERAVVTKQSLTKRSQEGSVPVHKPNTGNPSPQGAYTHSIIIIEGDATDVVNANQFTHSHSVTAETAGRLCCLKGQHHDQCKLYQ